MPAVEESQVLEALHEGIIAHKINPFKNWMQKRSTSSFSKKSTDYALTASDFNKYYKDCLFFGTGKYKGKLLTVTGRVVVSSSVIDSIEEDEDRIEWKEFKNKQTILIDSGYVPENKKVYLCEVQIEDNNTYEFVPLTELTAGKGKSSIVVTPSYAKVAMFSGFGSYRKGIYYGDYNIFTLPYRRGSTASNSLKEFFKKTTITTPTRDDFLDLFNCNRATLQISARYFAINLNEYSYPIVYSYGSPIGIVDSHGKVVTEMKGAVIDRYK